MPTDDQRAAIEKLNPIVQSTDEFRKEESENRLLKLATGDGMALIFYHSPEDLVECAPEISRALKEQHPELRLRLRSSLRPRLRQGEQSPLPNPMYRFGDGTNHVLLTSSGDRWNCLPQSCGPFIWWDRSP